MMTPREVAADYNLTAHGTVSSPGKFEGEAWYVVAIWDLVMNSYEDRDTGEDPTIAWFHVDADFVDGIEFHQTDREDFLATYPLGSYLGIWEDSQGFVYVTDRGKTSEEVDADDQGESCPHCGSDDLQETPAGTHCVSCGVNVDEAGGA